MHQLRVGDVLHVYMGALAGQAKYKFVVLVCCDAPIRCVLINSENAASVLNTRELIPTQVPIDVSRHAFLRYNSWIDGHELFGIPEEVLIAAVENGEHIGRVLPDILRDLAVAIEIAPTIVERQKQRALDAIAAELAVIAEAGEG